MKAYVSLAIAAIALVGAVLAFDHAGDSDSNNNHSPVVGQGSGNSDIFRHEFEGNGGRKKLGNPIDTVHAWYGSCVQDFTGSREVKSAIFELTPFPHPDCSRRHPFPGHVSFVGGAIWNEYEYGSGCGGQAAKVIGSPLGDAEPTSLDTNTGPLIQIFITRQGVEHELLEEETTGLVAIRPPVRCGRSGAKARTVQDGNQFEVAQIGVSNYNTTSACSGQCPLSSPTRIIR